jgi:hypothetical protein
MQTDTDLLLLCWNRKPRLRAALVAASCSCSVVWGFGFRRTGLWAHPRPGALGGALVVVMPRKNWSGPVLPPPPPKFPGVAMGSSLGRGGRGPGASPGARGPGVPSPQPTPWPTAAPGGAGRKGGALRSAPPLPLHGAWGWGTRRTVASGTRHTAHAAERGVRRRRRWRWRLQLCALLNGRWEARSAGRACGLFSVLVLVLASSSSSV